MKGQLQLIIDASMKLLFLTTKKYSGDSNGFSICMVCKKPMIKTIEGNIFGVCSACDEVFKRLDAKET